MKITANMELEKEMTEQETGTMKAPVRILTKVGRAG